MPAVLGAGAASVAVVEVIVLVPVPAPARVVPAPVQVEGVDLPHAVFYKLGKVSTGIYVYPDQAFSSENYP